MQTPRNAFYASVPSPWAAAWHLHLPVDGHRTVARNHYLSSRSRVAARGERLIEALRRLVADRNLALPRQLGWRDRDSLEARDRHRAGFVEGWGISAGRHLRRPGVAQIHPQASADDDGLGLEDRDELQPLHLHVGAAEAA
jgi:hypothetical protein